MFKLKTVFGVAFVAFVAVSGCFGFGRSGSAAWAEEVRSACGDDSLCLLIAHGDCGRVPRAAWTLYATCVSWGGDWRSYAREELGWGRVIYRGKK